MSRGRWSWPRYVPVAERRRKAGRRMKQLARKGMQIQPVEIVGRKIARTFWGEGWCDHLESFSDFANRLPRGRTYVRNGSVCHLGIQRGRAEAKVSGSALYDVEIRVQTLGSKRWKAVKKSCAGRVGSLLDLLQGRLSAGVMKVMTHRETGLFPKPAEIQLGCSCPDWAVMCKHVAAVLYGIGARLDERPELLFLLRGVDHEELIAEGADAAGSIAGARAPKGRRRLAEDALDEVFGIEIERPKGRRKARAGARPKARSEKRAGSKPRKGTKPRAPAKKAAPGKTPGKRKTPGKGAIPGRTVKDRARSPSKRTAGSTARAKKAAGKKIRAGVKAPRRRATPAGGPKEKARSRPRTTAGTRRRTSRGNRPSVAGHRRPESHAPGEAPSPTLRSRKARVGDSWITDARHLPDPADEDPGITRAGRNIARYFSSIVAAAAAETSESPAKTHVRCRRRPRRKPCPGKIRAGVDARTDEVTWECPVCGDNGTISGWRGSSWDPSAIPDLDDEASPPSVSDGEIPVSPGPSKSRQPVPANPFAGTWRIFETEVWDREALDLLGEAHLRFGRGQLGSLQMIAIEAGVDYRIVKREGVPHVEFSWSGFDDMHPASGRGWARLDGTTLRGQIFIHQGDVSTFAARRRTPGR